jgi:signal transduction histidine kinase
LTLLYTSLFVVGGAALIVVTYLLVAHALTDTANVATSSTSQQAVQKCLDAASQHGVSSVNAKEKCKSLYQSGVKAGATAQAGATLGNLLTYSLLSLGGVSVLALVAGWIVAGRILRPVHQITAAARAASEQDLTQRIDLQGPRDELRELADTFDLMLDRLDRTFTAQRQFIANASHELRTPLTVMRTTMDVVLAKPKPTHDELISMSADVRQAVDHAERLIAALLLLARNDQTRVLSDPLDLAVVAEDALEGRALDGLHMTTSLEEAPVYGDEVLLDELVSNLLENALRYNVKGGTVAVSTVARGDESVLSITNTGPAVPEEMVDRLFMPFTRLDDRTRHEGFGLGLALVSSIAAVHGASVQAKAAQGGGLDIRVVFPKREGDIPAADESTLPVQ